MHVTPTSHRPRARAAIAGMLVLIAAGSGALPAQAAPHSQATGRVAELAANHPGRSIHVIVRLADGRTQAEGRAAVRRQHGRVTGALHIFNGLAARLRAENAARLQRDPAVAVVSLDAAVKPQAINSKDLRTAYPFASNAPAAWNNMSGGGTATGLGVGVAVIDTGIAGAIPDLRVSSSDPGSRVIGSAVVNPVATTAEDSYGHGTHVAGILAGNGNTRAVDDPLRGEYVGIAPQASLISVKVDNDGIATVLDVIYGLEFVVDHKADYNIRVANLSLESTDTQSASTDPLDAAAEAAWFAGIAVVAAAGNRGTAPDAVTRAPGNDPYVITVGALDDMGTKTRDDDSAANWSGRGLTQDGHAKPDIYAPGAHIVSTLAPESAFESLCPACVVSGSYLRAGGTSMSAPVVSGVIALALERHPHLTPDQLKSLLVRSARGLGGGVAAVDADATVRNASNSSLPSANQGLTPSTLIDAATGGIDYQRSSWSRSSWSSSPSALTASWARSSWSCTCSTALGGEVDPTRSSWSRSSWSTSWTK